MASNEPDGDERAPSDTPAPVRVVLTVDLDRFDEVVETATAAGLVVEEEMRAIGVVSGKAVPSAMAALAEVDGVEAVEPERVIQLPPPDSPVQ